MAALSDDKMAVEGFWKYGSCHIVSKWTVFITGSCKAVSVFYIASATSVQIISVMYLTT